MSEAAETRTVSMKVLKENPDVYGGEEPHAMVYWGEGVDRNDHPYWVIDFLEAGGWMKHLPEPGYDETISGIQVEYNPDERNDIRKVILPDGTEITER